MNLVPQSSTCEQVETFENGYHWLFNCICRVHISTFAQLAAFDELMDAIAPLVGLFGMEEKPC